VEWKSEPGREGDVVVVVVVDSAVRACVRKVVVEGTSGMRQLLGKQRKAEGGGEVDG
jgi:hypothetical protein